MLSPFSQNENQISEMDSERDIRDMAREAQIQTEILIQQGIFFTLNLNTNYCFLLSKNYVHNYLEK